MPFFYCRKAAVITAIAGTMLLLALNPHTARADCPAYSESLPSVGYKASTGTLMACNGTSWISLTTAGDSVPTGAIMAFDLTSCPAGWSEYAAARGRFLRGIDNGAGNDPGGTRAPGNIQTDALQQHQHVMTNQNNGQDDVIAFADSNPDAHYASDGNLGTRGDVYVYVGNVKNANTAAETRPKNVAVLFCRKN